MYYSWKPSLHPAAPDNCTLTDGKLTIPSYDALNAKTLYDVFELHQPATTQTWEQTCGVLDVYKTANGLYCPHNNLDTDAMASKGRGYPHLAQLTMPFRQY